MKKIKDLSLVLSGVVLGIGILYAPTIYAATSSLLGTKVDKVMTVKLDDKKIGDAVVINGTSYLPVRATANAFNAEVAVNSSEISLTSGNDVADEPVIEGAKTAEQNAEIAKEQQKESEANTAKMNKLYTDKRAVEVKIEKAESLTLIVNGESYKRLQDKVKLFEERVSSYPDRPEFVIELESYKSDLAIMDKSIADAKANLPIWEKELADLEAQLAALK